MKSNQWPSICSEQKQGLAKHCTCTYKKHHYHSLPVIRPGRGPLADYSSKTNTFTRKKKKEKRKSSPKKDLIMLGSNRLPLFLFPQFNALLFPQTIIFTIFLNPVASNTNHFVFLLDSTANCLTTSQSLPENASNMRNNYLCRVGILPNMHQK